MANLLLKRRCNPIPWPGASNPRVAAVRKLAYSLICAFGALWIFSAAQAGAQPPGTDLAFQDGGDFPGQTPDHRGRGGAAQERRKDGRRGGRRADRRGGRNQPGGAAREVAVPPGVRVIPELEYAEVEGQSLRLDLYLPEEVSKDSPVPLLIWVHGGGWTKGDKRQIKPLFVSLVPEGYAAASINYRLGGVRLHPRQLHDVKGAIRWLRAQADRFGYDGARIALGGGSAGAHLALLAGLTGDQAALEGDTGGNPDVSSQVQAIVDMYGPGDLEKLAARKARFARNKSPQFLQEASPVNYIDPGDPPLLILHGDRDAVVPVEQSRRLHERYKAAGLVSDLHVIEDAGHGGKAFKGARAEGLVKDFLDRHLRSKQSRAGEQQEEARTLGSTPKSVPASSTGQSRIEAPPRMHGFHWLIGPQSGLGGSDEEFERLLEKVDKNLADSTCITGVHVIERWRLLEPKAGDYRFERLDRLLATVRRHERYYKLAVNPGVYSPDWLYAEGAQAFETLGSNPARRDIHQKKVRIPIPWDPLYQQRYYRLMGEIARRYGADPHFRAVVVTAATFMSPEWHLPRSKQDRERWRELAGFPERLEQVWTDGIDRFSALFPKQILVLEASSYPVGLRELGDAVVHHGATRYPGRFAVQINQLNGRFDQVQRPTYRKLLDYRRRYEDSIAIGLQNLKGWSFPKLAEKQGSLEMTAYNFVQANGEYWELWFGDGKDSTTCETLRGLRDKARDKDLAAFRKHLEDQNKYVADPGSRQLH